MLVKNVIRGNSVTFTSGFLDAANNTVVPNTAVLTLYYKSNNQYITVTANLAQNGTSWGSAWDSSNADVGLVEWHIQAVTANGNIATDGEFRIYANKANGGSGAE